jgi:hypothetical protein
LKYMPGLGLNHDPPHLSLLSSWGLQAWATGPQWDFIFLYYTQVTFLYRLNAVIPQYWINFPISTWELLDGPFLL